MKKKIIKIDENRCIGCGACANGCVSGVIQIVDGKARIIDEINCDGLGACIGECPVDAISLEERESASEEKKSCCPTSSPLCQFPIQLRLVYPFATCFKNKDLVLAADCTAFVCSNFHIRFMKNNSIVIACPKLDNSIELYVEKLTAMIEYSSINSLTVIMMETPCCSGLLQIAQQAQAKSKRKIPINKVIIEIE